MRTYKAIYSLINGGWSVRLEDELGYETKLIAKTGNVEESKLYAERIADALNKMGLEDRMAAKSI